MFSNLKEVDEVVEAALEPHMEIRENENENETGNNKLVVAQDVNWGEDDFYSGEEEFSNKPMPKWYRVILRESNVKVMQSIRKWCNQPDTKGQNLDDQTRVQI